MTTHDAYYHLRLTRDLLEGKYERHDEKRSPSDNITRPVLPPLLSVITASIVKITGASLDWAAFLMPPFFGLLVILPIFLWGRVFGGYICGLVASLLCVTSHFYYARTSIGWFDTDVLNVFFALMIPYHLFQYSKADGWKKGSAHLILSVILGFLFVWWWWYARFFIGLIFLVPLCVSVFLFRREKTRTAVSLGIIALACGVELLIFKIHGVGLEQIRKEIGYLSATVPQGSFPAVAQSVSELARPAVSLVGRESCGNIIVFIVAVMGLIALAVTRRRELLMLSVTLFAGILTFLTALRFLVFLVPFLAFGLGFLFQTAWKHAGGKKKEYVLRAVIVVLIVLSILPNFFTSWKTVLRSKTPAQVIKVLDDMNRDLPSDAVIWCWWDMGYTVQYWADRATFIDGGSQQRGLRTFVTALPLATANMNLSVNALKFFSCHGMAGLEKLAAEMGSEKEAVGALRTVLSATPKECDKTLKSFGFNLEEYKTFFYPESSGGVYLFLDGSLIGSSYWWYYFGSWDEEKLEGVHPEMMPVRMQDVGGYAQLARKEKEINVTSFFADKTRRTDSFVISKLAVCDPAKGKIDAEVFSDDLDGLVLQVVEKEGIAMAVSESFFDSVFNRLFVAGVYDNSIYEHVYGSNMFVKVWKAGEGQ